MECLLSTVRMNDVLFCASCHDIFRFGRMKTKVQILPAVSGRARWDESQRSSFCAEWTRVSNCVIWKAVPIGLYWRDCGMALVVQYHELPERYIAAGTTPTPPKITRNWPQQLSERHLEGSLTLVLEYPNPLVEAVNCSPRRHHTIEACCLPAQESDGHSLLDRL